MDPVTLAQMNIPYQIFNSSSFLQYLVQSFKLTLVFLLPVFLTWHHQDLNSNYPDPLLGYKIPCKLAITQNMKTPCKLKLGNLA